ncbi:MAG: acyl--CoA ligase [Deltaproteobacteria bacterium]|nr:acyl--CoA ligase [Deltaproteobacteria bacterium]
MTSVLLRSLDRHARERPNELAVREVGESGIERELTWRQLRDAACRLGTLLARSGRDEVLMIQSHNRAELLAGILGGLWANAAVLPVSPDLPVAPLVETARRCGVSSLITEEPTLGALAGEIARRVPFGSIDFDEPAGAMEPPPSAGGAILLQSSGTTGAPKIARRPAAALDAVGETCSRAIGMNARDAMLLCIPLYHSYAIDHGVLAAIVAGCAVELHRRFDPPLARAALAAGRISILPAVPVMLDALARVARGHGAAPALRRAYSAGSPLPRRIFDRFEQAYRTPVGQFYGTSEFGSVTFNDPDARDFVPEAVGRPLGGVEIRILDTTQPRRDRPLPVGSEGHVAVASPSMLSGYVDGECPIVDGFLLTGDLGRLDAGGTLTLTGRLKLLIDVGGLKVNPLEVEAVLMRHPAVREAVTLELPYSDTTSRLKAIIIPEDDREVGGEELQRFAREQLIHYKVPRVFEIRKTVPRSPTGKILREELQRALFTEEQP